MLTEKAADLTFADPQSFGEMANVVIVQRAVLDQRHGARHRGRGAAPCAEIGRTLRPATQARPKSSLLRRRRCREEFAMFSFGWTRRADRSAINPRRLHASEEQAVVSRIARQHGRVTNVKVDLHGAHHTTCRNKVWRFSDVEETRTCRRPERGGNQNGEQTGTGSRRYPGPVKAPRGRRPSVP